MLHTVSSAKGSELSDWTRLPEAAGLLASIAKRPCSFVIESDDWHANRKVYVGDRVDCLRRIYRQYGEQVQAACDALWLAAGGPRATDAQTDAIYAPLRAWVFHNVEDAISEVLCPADLTDIVHRVAA